MIVVGGGAAGYMGAITAAEQGFQHVLLLEGTHQTLEKVRLSGGGRCNVTHAAWDPRDLVSNYPRGNPELLGPFSRFAAGDAVSWFADRGVELREEADGRMFPSTNSSLAIIKCLQKAARIAGVQICKKAFVVALEPINLKRFLVHVKGGIVFSCRNVLLATGGHPSGRRIAESMGHKIVSPVPSLFTLGINVNALNACSGISIDCVDCMLDIAGKSFHQTGKLLITHWGLSGPAILRLTAFAARALHENNYKGFVTINWTGMSSEAVRSLLSNQRHLQAKRIIGTSASLFNLPKRIWLFLLNKTRTNPDLRWGEFSRDLENNLLQELVSSRYNVNGRGPFGEEFVIAGGVDLLEVNLQTMESKVCKHLYLAGELLDIDGVTGGFNFQHCWSSGWIAGHTMAKCT